MTEVPVSHIYFYLNKKEVIAKNVQPETTLLQYLRSSEVGLTGSKLGCGEGGCGACTVMLSHYVPETQHIVHRAVNACLAPLCSVDGMMVTTIEGLGNVRDGLHPVQQRIASAHGSQCGFCTPGIAMALYAFLRSHPKATMKDIEENFDGNLCRCTGYRPILDAAKTFGQDCPPSACGMGSACCRVKKDENGKKEDKEEKKPEKEDKKKEEEERDGASDAFAEPIFPPALMKYKPAYLRLVGDRVTWLRPLSLPSLLQLKQEHPQAKLVVGNTEIGIEVKFKNAIYPVIITPTHIPELCGINVTDNGVEVGASVTINDMRATLANIVKERKPYETRGIRAMLAQIKLFAGNQIRNSACLAGNIVTASPISDLNPVWVALGAVLTVSSAKDGIRKVPMDKFFIKYRVVDLKPEEVVISLHIPFTKENEYVEAYKQSRRREDDIAIVSCCFRVELDDNKRVKSSVLAYGGMAVKVVTAPLAQEFLVGKEWNKTIFPEMNEKLAQDLPLSAGAPGGMIEYRRSLTTSFFFKFFLLVLDTIKDGAVGDLSNGIPEDHKSAIAKNHREVSKGEQGYKTKDEMAPVGAPVAHLSAFKQVTGEAIYTDDIPTPPRGLYAALVMSARAHAELVSVDASPALALPGVVAFFGANDIPGANQVGPVFKDEELFASKEVHSVGFVIGIIVAETHQQALAGTHKVKVVYKDLPHVITIEQAIEQDSYLNMHHIINRGDIEVGFAEADHVIEGSMKVGGQEHFYLETNTTLAIPGEGGEMDIFCSSQNPTKTQGLVASVLGVGANKVVVKVKRMGGGFGGKETRSIYVSCAAAVAAAKLNRPVRIALDRDTDMMTSGYRHPFLGNYKVGFTKTGKIMALDVDLYADAGYSFDLSGGVLDRAIFHSENAYYIPHVHVSGKLCKTNLPTNTAFRGFGGPQGMIICEAWVERIAEVLDMPVHKVREINFYQEGQLTHYHQPVLNSRMDAIWTQLMERSEYVKRQEEVRAFNKNNRWKKRGISIIPTKFGMSFTVKALNQAGALVHVYTDGTVLVTHGGTEMGQGLHTKMAQIAAKAFGIPLSDVHIADTSTDKVANTSPTAASVSSDMNGMAVLNACEMIAERLAPYKEKNPKASFKEIALIAHMDRINLTANGFYKTPDVGYVFKPEGLGEGTPFNYFNFGASCSEVEIDVLTGDYHIIRTDILMDVGDSLNPAIDIGQIEGAFIQGVGWCTMEELVFLGNGVLFTRGPSTYKIPGFNDVPLDFRVSLLSDAPNPRAIHSSKGVGEPPLFLSASVFFAIRDAIKGARESAGKTEPLTLYSPATCERIRIACEDSFTDQFTAKQ